MPWYTRVSRMTSTNAVGGWTLRGRARYTCNLSGVPSDAL